MNLQPLANFRARVQIGAALPFGIHDAAGRLLLAAGQRVSSEAQLETLLERQAQVDLREPPDKRTDPAHAPVGALNGLWGVAVDRLGQAFSDDAIKHADFLRQLDSASAPVLALIERDPDLALFQVLRQQGGSSTRYGVQRSVHAATASFLGAMRLQASPDEARRAFRAGLTMNLSMLALQGQLAEQVGAPLPLQRDVLAHHGPRSRELLEAHEVRDLDWLEAVEHHAEADVPGRRASPLTVLIRMAEVLTSTYAMRQTRPALMADQAARRFFSGRQALPEAAALLKEFGLYPPGTPVRLASGECGVVVKRGSAAHAPLVACVRDRGGEALIEPRRRDCTHPEHAVAEVLSFEALRVRISPERLLMAA